MKELSKKPKIETIVLLIIWTHTEFYESLLSNND